MANNPLKNITCILIPNYNGSTIKYKDKGILANCLYSIRANTKGSDVKIILIDDGSTDDSVKLAEKYTEDLIRMPTNTGNISKVLNAGITYTLKKYKPKYLVLLNNDVIITDNRWLQNLISISESEAEIGMVGCKLLYPNKKIQHAGLIIGATTYNRGRAEIDFGKYDSVEEVSGVTFALVLIKSKVIKKVGLLDPNFKMGYEDADYCFRTKRSGFRIMYNGKVKAIHLEGFTSKIPRAKYVVNKAFYRNQSNNAYFALKNLSGYTLFKSLLFILASSFISIEDKNRERKLLNIRIKHNLLRNLLDSFDAISDAIKLANKNQTNNR